MTASRRIPELVRLAGFAVAGALAVVAVERVGVESVRGPAAYVTAGPQPRASTSASNDSKSVATAEISSSVAVAGATTWSIDAVISMTDEAASDSTLASLALSDPAPAVREEALYALSVRGGGVALQTLQQASQDLHPQVRRAAIHALGTLGGAQAEQALVATLNIADPPPVLLETIDALGLTGGTTARWHLERLRQHENDVVREAAADWVDELSVTH
jgi:HEAT repeat protein